MAFDTGETQSIWMQNSSAKTLCPIVSDDQVDVCIVGGGIAGLSTAYFLLKEGLTVAVIDDGPIGGGQTERTSAHLSSALDDRFSSLEKRRGVEVSRVAYESHADAISRIEAIVREEGIECDFERVDGYLFAPPSDSTGALEKELAAAHRAGFEDADLVDAAPLASVSDRPVVRFPRQAQFHPMRYLAGLAEAVTRRGGKILTGTRASEIEGGKDAHVTTTNGRKVLARNIVVATNSPVNDRVVIHTKLYPYTTYCLALRVPKGSVPKGLYWDTLDPYHYVRVTKDETGPLSSAGAEALIAEGTELLIVGGEDHKTGQADDAPERYARLEAWTREHFPMVQDVAFAWSGQVMETLDGLGYIGRNPADSDNVFVMTGDSGMGLTHGTLGGVLVTDLIVGRENAWSRSYEPSRRPIATLPEYVTENANVAAQYADWLRKGDVTDTSEIAPGQGAVVRRGASLVAAYRDENGALKECSAVCPHLHGIVRWNSDEATWDCPCHGSRFDAEGRVIQGPANRDLAPAGGEIEFPVAISATSAQGLSHGHDSRRADAGLEI